MPRLFIVTSRFYDTIAVELERGARACLEDAGASFECFHVPGAFELPAAVAQAAASGRYDGYVALGCVIRGETTHYDYVCAESARGLMQLATQERLALGYGILTVETPQQAWERAAVTLGNKGKDAAEACLALLALRRHFAEAAEPQGRLA